MSRLDTVRTKASVTWKLTEWKMWTTYLGTNKEGFNTELYFLGEVLNISLKGRQTGWGRVSQETANRWTKSHIWANSRAAIAQLQHTAT